MVAQVIEIKTLSYLTFCCGRGKIPYFAPFYHLLPRCKLNCYKIVLSYAIKLHKQSPILEIYADIGDKPIGQTARRNT